MSRLLRERFTTCHRAAAITDAHLNGGYAARLTTGGDPRKAALGATLSGSAADINEIFGEIKGAVPGPPGANAVTVQSCGTVELRTDMTEAQINAAIGHGVLSTKDGTGIVKAAAAPGAGRGRTIGPVTRDGVVYAVVDLDTN